MIIMSTTLCVYQIVWVNSVGDDLQEFAPQFPFSVVTEYFRGFPSINSVAVEDSIF